MGTLAGPGRRRYYDFQDVMRYRIMDILLVSTPYDNFILEEAGERQAGFDADFPLVAFAGLGHQTLLDEVKDGVAFKRLAFGVEAERPVVRNAGLRPIDAEGGEADFTHHGVPGLVPELAGHVAVVAPGFAFRLVDDTGHHFGNVDFAEALEEHHERLGPGLERWIVEEGFGVDALIEEVLEALVATGDGIVDVGLGGVHAFDVHAGRRRGSVQATGSGEAVVEVI